MHHWLQYKLYARYILLAYKMVLNLRAQVKWASNIFKMNKIQV